MVVRRSLIARVGGFRTGYDGAQDYDLLLRLTDRTTRIRHVPKVLYHRRTDRRSTARAGSAKTWAHDAGTRSLEDHIARNGLDATVMPGGLPGLYRVRFGIKGDPFVSIVTPAMSNPAERELASACVRTIETLADRTGYRRFELVLPSDGERLHPQVMEILRDAPCRHVRVERRRVFDRISNWNAGAANARGDHLLFLDWGLTALDADWLTALLEYSQQAAVGAVGGKLYHSNGRLKHIGLLLGIDGSAAPALHGYPSGSLGHFCSAVAVRNYSAVSAACMMTRRSLFAEVGGFREDLFDFGDVDYCLRVRTAGHRVVFSPYAALSCDGPLKRHDSPAFAEHSARLRALWSEPLARDPHYNINFSRQSPNYEPDVQGPVVES